MTFDTLYDRLKILQRENLESLNQLRDRGLMVEAIEIETSRQNEYARLIESEEAE